MRQIMYISSSAPRGAVVGLDDILRKSRETNAANGVTGLLYSDGRRFLQVLEGEPDAVGGTFERIRADPRHQAIVVLHDRVINGRQFGDWAMLRRDSLTIGDMFDQRMHLALECCSPEVRGTFEGLVTSRRAA